MGRRSGRFGPRRILRGLTRCRHLLEDLRVDRVELRFSRPLRFEQRGAETLDRASIAPRRDLLASSIGVVAHSLGMRARAIRLALNERRTLAGAGTLNGVPGNLSHRGDVIPIHFDARNAVRGTATRHTGIARGVAERDLGRELVVLADKQNRKPPNAGHVQGFVERPVVDRAIAKEGDRHTIGLEHFETIARTRCLKNARADDSARTHHPNLRREEMHAPAASPGATGCTPEQFCDEFPRRQPLGQCVTMSAVRAEKDVVLSQLGADAHGDGLLPHVGVTRAMNEPALMTAGELLLRLTDELHRAIPRDRFLFRMAALSVCFV